MRISDLSSDVCSSDLGCSPQRSSPARESTGRSKMESEFQSHRHASLAVTAVLATATALLPISAAASENQCGEHKDVKQLLLQKYNESPRSDEHTSELQSLMRNSYAVFCLQKQKQIHKHPTQQYIFTKTKK